MESFLLIEFAFIVCGNLSYLKEINKPVFALCAALLPY